MPFPFPFTMFGANRASDAGGVTCDFTYCFGGGWVQGKVGNYGIHFDGVNDHVTVNNGSDIFATSKGTISMWMKPTFGSLSYPEIFTTADNSNNNTNTQLYLNSADSYKVTHLVRAGAAIGVNKAGGIPIENAWNHLAITSNGAISKIYLNGVDTTVAGGADDGDWFADAPGLDKMTIGSLIYNGAAAQLFYSGSIDEFAIWDVALTPAQINLLSTGSARADSIIPEVVDGDWSTGSNKKIGTYAIGEFDRVANYVSCSWDSNIDFDYDDPFSWSIWVKPTDLAGQTGNNAVPCIVSKEKYASPGSGFICSTDSDGKIWFSAICNNNNSSAGYLYVNTGDGELADDTWAHVVCTYDGTGGDADSAAGFKIYVDGAAVSVTQTDTARLTAGFLTGRPLQMARRGPDYTGATKRFFKGYLDDFSIWNVELDSGSISELYTSGSANIGAQASGVSSSALQGYWSFDNPGPGSTTISGSRGLDATMMGSMDGGATGSLLMYYDFEIGDSNPVSGNFPTSTTVYDVVTASSHGPTAHTGTMTSMAVADFGSWTQGKMGKYSLDFDDNYVDLPLGAATGSSTGQAGSIAAWIYADAISNYPVIFGASKDSGTTDYMRCGISTNGSYLNNLTFASIVGSTWGPFVYATSAGTNNDGKVVAGEWTHVVWSSDGTTTSMYLNGTAATSASIGTGPKGRWFGDLGLTTGYNVQLGGIQYNGTNPEYALNGKLDEVGVWSEVLNLGGVQALYNDGVGAKATTVSSSYLISYYDMECDGPGSANLKDLSGNSYDGTLTNMSSGTCGSG